ncbi:MAG TPA: UvrY/SirA/GacA family response regulator transcription factor, partial [Gammaproteobacteria bacterium]|nr:UvrY/SirA/GacA family response regulator transcription factor [Gammaproteobacteria bacterium]
MINVLVVDDHDLVRSGIVRLLSDISGITVVGEASNGEEAVKIAREKRPHVVLMDIRMPGIGGLEATRKIVHHNPEIKVIALTIYENEPFPTKLLQAGASGYLTKGALIDEMVLAIRTVYAGNRYLGPEIAQQMALKSVAENELSPFEQLSERELQVMIMITAGQNVQMIAEKLCVTPKTINSYRYR